MAKARPRQPRRVAPRAATSSRATRAPSAPPTSSTRSRGRFRITECSADDSHCDLEDVCNVGGAWQRINVAIRRALGDINLNDLQRSKLRCPGSNLPGCRSTSKDKRLTTCRLNQKEIESLVNRRYEHGFVTDIATDSFSRPGSTRTSSARFRRARTNRSSCSNGG